MRLFALLCIVPHALAILQWPSLSQQQPLQRASGVAYHPFDDGFDDFVADTMSEFKSPGVSIAVVHGNKTFSKAYGYADLATKEPMTPRTLFFAGSTTKSFVAATMSKLVYSNASEYAEVTWDTRLANLIREDFVLQDEYATNHITLTDAMSHRTGMPRHDLSWTNGNPSVRHQVQQLRLLPLHTELRTKWEYCNLMWTAVSHAIETITAMPMVQLLQSHFFSPLGMTETFYDLDDALAYVNNTKDVVMATGYLWDNATSSQIPVPLTSIPPSNGAGGVISNVLDYTHWIRAFFPSSSTSPIEPAAVQYMTDAHMPFPAGRTPSTGPRFYGQGLESMVYRGHLVTGHDGGINGYMTKMMWIADLEFGIMIMTNAFNMMNEIVFWRLLDDFLDTPEAERYNAVQMARDVETERLEKMANAKELLYPEADKLNAVAPTLPLTAYEGTYYHPAYQNLTLSLSPGGDIESHSGRSGPSMTLHTGRTTHTDQSGVFHHVSGEHWWVQWRWGPSHWLTDAAGRARFSVGASGKVEALWFEADMSVDASQRPMARFEKLE